MLKATDRPKPLACLTLTGSDVQLIIEFRIVDVDLIWIDTKNGTCTLTEYSATFKKSKSGPPYHIFIILEYLPSILSTESNIIVKFIPEGQCGEARTGNVHDGGQVEPPYCTVNGICRETEYKNQST